MQLIGNVIEKEEENRVKGVDGYIRNHFMLIFHLLFLLKNWWRADKRYSWCDTYDESSATLFKRDGSLNMVYGVLEHPH